MNNIYWKIILQKKRKVKKTRANSYNQTNKENLQERLREYLGNFSEDDKIKREIMLTLKIKIYQTQIEKGKKDLWKNIIIKKKFVKSSN